MFEIPNHRHDAFTNAELQIDSLIQRISTLRLYLEKGGVEDENIGEAYEEALEAFTQEVAAFGGIEQILQAIQDSNQDPKFCQKLN